MASTQSKASILLKYIAECNRPPAQRLEDCIVDFDNDDDDDSSVGASKKRKVGYSNEANVVRSKTIDAGIERAVQTFLSSGCCIIPNALPESFVDVCKSKAVADLDLLNSELQSRRDEAATEATTDTNNHKLASAYRVDYREMVDRDGLRRDVRFELDKYPFSAGGLIYNSKIFPVIKELLGGEDNVNLLYAGVMWARQCDSNESEENKQSQRWHADGGHLFHHAHQPPHCINVFFPLIDLTKANGPTEVKPGSQRLGCFDDDASHASIPLEAKKGSAILFDYRIKHRGGINLSNEDRPILYLAYSKPWFRDAGNTRAGISIFKNRHSLPWVSRILTGEAMGATEGFDNVAPFTPSPAAMQSAEVNREQHLRDEGNAQGSGEQWILFKMNVQLDDNREEMIVVHSGDIASEIATQFCRKHNLTADFIPVLTETIQQQINQATT